MEREKLLELAKDAATEAVCDLENVIDWRGDNYGMPVVSAGPLPDGMLHVQYEWDWGEFPRDTSGTNRMRCVVDVSAADPTSESSTTHEWLLKRGKVQGHDVVVYIETSAGDYTDENYDAWGQITVYFPQDKAAASKLVADLKRQIGGSFGRMIVPRPEQVKELMKLDPPVEWDVGALLEVAQRVHAS